MRPWITVCSILITLAFSGLAQAQAILSPPFGLKWGEAPEKFFKWAEAQKLDVTIEYPSDKPGERYITISNRGNTLPKHQATSLEAHFRKGRLYEVSLHYQLESQSYEVARSQFFQAKRDLTAKHGQFKLTHKKRDVLPNDFTINEQSYHIEPVAGLFLMLSYSEIRDNLRNSQRATFSVIYHNDNIITN
ncbi:hypothetical protein [Rubritalea marina]|uniref:hypothetical protein n=1 Tax=Rubritalea marina TaxID=361055 RepID=UPI0003684A48|nr:hypothetical protein [Rubritalea marina]